MRSAALMLVFAAAGVTSVRAQPMASDVVSCLVLPWESISVAAPSEGLVREIFVDRGDKIAAGDLLIQLDDSIQRSYLELMQARANDASGVELAEIRLQIAQSGYERNRALFERQQLTGDDWDRIRGTYELAVVELRQAQNAALQASLELARAKAAHAQTQIVAPADAVVVQRLVSVGEAAGAEPLLELAVTDRLRVEVFARAQSYARWTPGEAVNLAVQLPEPAVLAADVRTINTVSDAGTGVVGVLLELDNAAGAILPGQSCQIPREETS
ncbi:efflux RND transporter periplasmic adaptor subunit [Devosia chinhatensis]|uniref:Uncharacterized protein n=1 Tax=Devosia chinhatensis TaxID=429727 RepID=A0A0F5FJ88_9HYPH|nr:efflux RND transporter periplasmic adaptor subunit [Devosia chinhatensis]KKB08615.1 hypothetical protein VE26_00505 [Devosia chinhatensis]